MAAITNPLVSGLLKETSRSFYLTLRVLPRKVRAQIGLAYLLARTADTIADTGIVQVEKRLAALQRLRERILGTNRAALDFGELARQQGLPAERVLLEKVEASLTVLESFEAEDLNLIRLVLDTITSGQELDLRRFDGASADKLMALQTDAELEDYTYRVAGCVGEFWTKVCRARLFPTARLDDVRQLTDGVRFGKGLQLVNILRDVPADLRQGRCYLPEQGISKVGLKVGDLLHPSNEKAIRPLYDHYLELAEAHLAAGWAYTNALPWRFARVRLACAWPILIGVKTIARLRVANALDPRQRVKISRAEVRGLIFRSLLWYPLPGVWQRLAGLPTGGAGKPVASGPNLT